MDLDGRIVVKLPITLEGAKAANRLIQDGVPVTMTGGCVVGGLGGSFVGRRPGAERLSSAVKRYQPAYANKQSGESPHTGL